MNKSPRRNSPRPMLQRLQARSPDLRRNFSNASQRMNNLVTKFRKMTPEQIQQIRNRIADMKTQLQVKENFAYADTKNRFNQRMGDAKTNFNKYRNSPPGRYSPTQMVNKARNMNFRSPLRRNRSPM
jgi:predicted  nucleic acid-binding Zn-ribbon protein